MDKFLLLDLEERKRYMVNTARKLKLPVAIIEKDFWVCFMLNYLFTDFKYKDFICFKGGTSLSKVYHCIDRFSEDIDLAVDWSVIGILKEEAYAKRSNRQQDFFNKETNVKTEVYLKDIWLPLIKKDLESILQDSFDLYIEDSNLHTISFKYPRVYDEASILQVIRLEIGALAEPVPSSFQYLSSYLSEAYPTLFRKEICVRTVDIYRTFYEKVTILHREANRLNGNYPARYSRHFYDIYQMIQKGVANEALMDINLLRMVVEFKKKFYPCNWAKYDEVLIGKCKLIPNEKALTIFSKDYNIMKNMFYGNYPTFDEIILSLHEFETMLNKAIHTQYIEVPIQ